MSSFEQPKPDQDPAKALLMPAKSQSTVSPGFFKHAVELGKTPDTTMKPEDVTSLLANADASRKSDDVKKRYHQQKRTEFERKVSIKLSNNDKVKEAVQKLSDKAFSYMMKTRGETGLAELGADPRTAGTPAYGGMVGKDPATIKDVLSRGEKGGNIREQMFALQKFQNVLGSDLLDPEKGVGAEKMKEAAARPSGAGLNKDGAATRVDFTSEDLKRLQARQASVQQSTGGKDVTAKQFYSPTKNESSKDHTAYANAKKQDMDTKLPSMPSASAQQAMPGLTGKLPPALKAPDAMLQAGELSPLARSQRSVESVEAEGLKLSDREKKMAVEMNADGGAVEVPWIEGQKANIVDKEAQFINEANDKAMPLKAGISGTTFRMMELAQLMGLEGDEAALIKSACMSSLISVEAHSMHEVTVASSGFMGEQKKDESGGQEAGDGKKDEPKMESLGDSTYSPQNVKPLEEKDLHECAAAVGCSIGFIRTGVPGEAPGDVAPVEPTGVTSPVASAGPTAAPPIPPGTKT